MTKTYILAALLAVTEASGHCQALAQAPAFEVASITPCPPGTPANPGEHAGMVQFIYPGGRLDAKATTVKFLLEWAYGIQPSQHSGGPAWIDTDRYDIVAKTGGDATNPTAAQMKLMTQTLLRDRFKLKIRHETKELPVYVISLGKNPPKLFPPKDGEVLSMGAKPQMGQNGKIAAYRLVATRFSLAQLTETFGRQLDRPVLNQTGLDGEYDFTLDLTPDESGTNFLDVALLMSAMREQLGLTLKSQKSPIDVLVIDSAERVAAGN